MATVGDTFVEASSDTALSSHTPTGANAGTSWVTEEQTGTRFWRVSQATDNLAADNVEVDDRIISTIRPNPSVADYRVEFQVIDSASGGDTRPLFAVGRLTDTSNYYAAGVYRAAVSGDAKIWKKVGGTPSEIASGDTGIANNDTIALDMAGSTIRLLKNGAQVLSVTDTSLTSPGRAGIGMGNAFVPTDDIGAWRIDNFQYVEADAVHVPVSSPIYRTRMRQWA